MAESLIPEIIPGLVAVQAKEDNKESGEKRGDVKNVFPIDAKELLMTGNYELVENGAVEAARLNANPLRSAQASVDSKLVVAEVTGIAGQVHMGTDEKEVEQLRMQAAQPQKAESNSKPAVTPQPAKATGNPTGAKSEDDKK